MHKNSTIPFVINSFFIVPILLGVLLLLFFNPSSEKDQSFLKEQSVEVVARVQNKNQGLYYFGFASCPWCQDLLPILEDELVASQSKIYTVNTKSSDFSEHQRSVITDVFRKNIGGDKLYVPFLVAINSAGEVKTHTGTVVGHDASKEGLSLKQQIELRKILKSLIGHAKS